VFKPVNLNGLYLGLSYDAVSNAWLLERQMVYKNDFCCQICYCSGESCFSLFEGIKSHSAAAAEKYEEPQSLYVIAWPESDNLPIEFTHT
jgi:hypothetical protein